MKYYWIEDMSSHWISSIDLTVMKQGIMMMKDFIPTMSMMVLLNRKISALQMMMIVIRKYLKQSIERLTQD